MKSSKTLKANYGPAHKFPSPVGAAELDAALAAIAHRPKHGRTLRRLFAASLPTLFGPLVVLLTSRVDDIAVLVASEGKLVPRAEHPAPLEEGHGYESNVRLTYRASPLTTRWALEPRATFPAGGIAIPPEPLGDADWSKLASQTHLRDTLSPASGDYADKEYMGQFDISPGGAELADHLLGAKFSNTRPWGALYVVADEYRCGVDVFAMPRGGRLRQLVTLNLDM